MDIAELLVSLVSASQDQYLRNTEKPPLEIPDTLDVTKKKLAEMFMEHISTNILDSGGHYGYNYQRSRENPEWLKPEYYTTFEIEGNGELFVWNHLSTFHHLANQLYYNKEWDDKFQEWKRNLEEQGKDWEEFIDEFPIPDGNGDLWKERLYAGYTYNYETLLDRDYIFDQAGDAIIIRIHNGCDARGGFTEPVLFECTDTFSYDGRATVQCSHCGAYWDYYNYGFEDGDCDGVKDADFKALEDYPCEKGEEGKKGIVVVTEEGKAFCPICGKGMLE